MALELIDTQTTDGNGEASITYTGTGAGEIEFRAKVSTLLQETYELWDYLFYDKGQSGDGNHNDNWFNQNTAYTIVRGDEYTTLSQAGGSYRRILPDASSLTSYPFSIDTVIEFTLGTVNGVWNFTIPKTSENLSNLDIGLILDSNKTIKITITASTITIEKDGVVVDTKTTSDYIDNSFQAYFICNHSNSLQYKDLKVYSA